MASGQVEIDDVPHAVLVAQAQHGVLLSSGAKKFRAQEFSLAWGDAESGSKDAGLMPAAKVDGTQAVVAELLDVHDSAIPAWQLHLDTRLASRRSRAPLRNCGEDGLPAMCAFPFLGPARRKSKLGRRTYHSMDLDSEVVIVWIDNLDCQSARGPPGLYIGDSLCQSAARTCARTGANESMPRQAPSRSGGTCAAPVAGRGPPSARPPDGLRG